MLEHMPGDPASVKELDDRLTLLEARFHRLCGVLKRLAENERQLIEADLRELEL